MNHKSLRIALVHDYLKEYGGAEVVLETLGDIFPEADIYTTLYHPASFGPHRSRLTKKWRGRIHQSFFKYIPFAHKLISPLRFISPLAFRSFDFSRYDLVITSATGAYFPNSLNKKTAKLICYCHTPPRYLYGLVTARQLDSFFYRLVNVPLQFVLHFYRLFDFTYAQNVDQYIANSATTAARIQKFYRRDSVVINPPVDLPILKSPPSSRGDTHRVGGFFLTGGRLAFAKRYDIAIQACNRLKLPLKVFGRDFAGFEAKLKNISGPTVEFLGEISNEKRYQLMSEAKAFIFCSDNEDFGIIPVEAMSAGCPVIGYKSGGVTETVVNGKTGILFNQLTPESCIDAIKKFEKSKIKSSDCLSQAKKFSKEKFISKIESIVNS